MVFELFAKCVSFMLSNRLGSRTEHEDCLAASCAFEIKVSTNLTYGSLFG